jgi:uncharacterized protein (DUF433 family)
VDFIIGLRAEGWSEADILQNYPGVTHEDITASLDYARYSWFGESVPARAMKRISGSGLTA